ncbi:MAG: sigma-70 family RNA polymerase sigma factor [Bryobacterales bacterium]|nr:sigma-70 family RNA polymerase sigma factor [Bryobacterales bacterium]
MADHAVPGEMEEKEFERLYLETAPAIRAYILHHCSDYDSADDLCQATFTKFLEIRRRDRKSVRSPRAYLYRIASSVIADHGRKLQRRRAFAERAKRSRTHRPTEAHAERIALRDALRLVSQRERQLLWLLYGEGFRHKEVARIMNINAASVRVLAFRARRKLLRRLGGTAGLDRGT